MIKMIINVTSVIAEVVYLLTFYAVFKISSYWSRREEMSEKKRTKEEYTERYADTYCNGDQEEAAGHAIVKEVCKTLNEE